MKKRRGLWWSAGVLTIGAGLIAACSDEGDAGASGDPNGGGAGEADVGLAPDIGSAGTASQSGGAGGNGGNATAGVSNAAGAGETVVEGGASGAGGAGKRPEAGGAGGEAAAGAGVGGDAGGSGYQPGLCGGDGGTTPPTFVPSCVLTADDADFACRACLKNKACADWQACYGDEPRSACGYGPQAGDQGQFDCVRACFVDDAAGGADAQEVLRACEDACTNGCGVFVNDDTSMLLSTAQDFCFGECFPIE